MNRRKFLGITGLSAATALALGRCAPASTRVPWRVGHGPIANYRRERDQDLRVACIGVGGRGLESLNSLLAEAVLGPNPEFVSISAICDVDQGMLDAAGIALPHAARFRDFRAMFRAIRMGTLEIDAVMVSTPDHTHAVATALALACGLPVYCEKPLTHTIEQARTLRAMARVTGAPTQMGTQIHAGSNYHSVVELIQSGAIGRITSCDCWVGKAWCCGKLTPGAIAPSTLDWDLWQGPIPATDYIDSIAPANWRKYWAYGSGTLGDMGCHILDLPFWALGLAHHPDLKAHIQTDGPPVDQVGCPESLEVSWALSPLAPPSVREPVDPVVLRWFDGGRVSPTVQELSAKDGQKYHDRFNVLFQGSSGFLLANYGEYLILPPTHAAAVTTPPPSHPRPLGHHREWIDAVRAWTVCQSAAQTGSDFAYSTKLTELVLSGVLGYRAGAPITYDFASGSVTGDGAGKAREYLNDPVRSGWSITGSDLAAVLA